VAAIVLNSHAALGMRIRNEHPAARLHSALGYLSPDEFERRAAQSTTAEIPPAPRISFSRHKEI
jgi:hypothetical protein